MEELIYRIQLVEGTYSPTDSAEVLLTLIADKIKFHNLQIICLKDRNHAEIIHAEKRKEYGLFRNKFNHSAY